MTFSPVYESYIAPARARPQIWRLLAGLVLIALVYVFWLVLIGGGVVLVGGLDRLEARLAEIGQGSDPGTLMVLLFTFAGMGVGAMLAARLLHGRSMGSLFGRAPVVLRDFALGFGILGGLALVTGLPGLLFVDLEPGLALEVWLRFLPLALVGLLIQTGAEELVFRGYMQQQLAARFRSPLVWMVLPSVLFGLAHYAPAEMGPNTWHVVLATGVFGLVAADLTARTGSLGLAWGLHFANNIFAILFITAGGALDGMALGRLPYGPDDTEVMRPLILADIALIGLTWALCRLALRAR